MNSNRVFVIGNGFDLEHGLKTGYLDFREFLEINYPNLEEKMSIEFDLIGDNINQSWSTFENSLSYFDENYFAAKMTDDYMGEDFLYHSAAAENFNRKVIVFEEIKELFSEWIASIKIISNHRRKDISNEDLYLTFNYTEVLEQLHDIDDQSIYHVHGKHGKTFILGHETKYSNRFFERKFDKDGIDPVFDIENTDPRLQDIRESIFKQLDAFYKPIKEEVLPQLKNWLINNPPPREIVVLGHSYGKADWEYFKFLKEIYPDVPWTYSVFDKPTEERLLEMLSNQK